jgi:esterase/lipase
VGELAQLAAAGAAIGGLAASLLAVRYTNRKIAAETTKLEAETGTGAQKALAETVAALAESSRAEIAAVRLEIDRVRRERDGCAVEVARLRRYVGELVDLMRKAGLAVPVMRPAPRQPRADA